MTDHRIIFLFLACAAALIGAISLLAPDRRVDGTSLESAFLRLDETVRRRGIEGFLSEKESLRRTVSGILRHRDEPVRAAMAESIAVFLFPEILPEENFEKHVAEELWGRGLREIETSPHTERARSAFEEIRTNVWSYEAADKSEPRLSPAARQVLTVYDILSAP